MATGAEERPEEDTVRSPTAVAAEGESEPSKVEAEASGDIATADEAKADHVEDTSAAKEIEVAENANSNADEVAEEKSAEEAKDDGHGSNWKNSTWSERSDKNDDWNSWKDERKDANTPEGESLEKDGNEPQTEKIVKKQDKLSMSLDDLIWQDQGSKGRSKGWGEKNGGGSGWSGNASGGGSWGGGSGGSWRGGGGAGGDGGGGGGGGGAAWKDWKSDDWKAGNNWKSDSGGESGRAGGGDGTSSWSRDDWKGDKKSWQEGGDHRSSDTWNGGGGGSGRYDKSYDKPYDRDYDQEKNTSSGGNRYRGGSDRERDHGGRGDREEPRSNSDRQRSLGDIYSRREDAKFNDRRTIIVDGIDGTKVDRRDLEDAFGEVGRVEYCVLKESVATITFRESRAAQDAVRRFHGGQLNDRTIDVFFEGDEHPKRAKTARSRSRGNGGRTSGAAPVRGSCGARQEGPVSRSRSRRPREAGGGRSDRRSDHRIADERPRGSRRDASPRRAPATERSRR
eukprot:TRINITY_DN54503_c0_g1_i1.p1 TRINITY_DN54503_c0_g1~~TRINITY_DN54503_c0_g1_i1.p1  ORF type:complete len:530 (-),score=113.37 TRINITY_DN54503_c0_g1_i1:111-1637(-)